ncbi:glycosyltransferase family 2 protein [Synechococcus moorigangaii CMS01]|nr:glycosyltransferase family 2 protein [Synechococcus moorigangaii CMS01]
MEILQFPKFRLTALPPLPMGLSFLLLLLLPIGFYHLLWQRGWNLLWLSTLITSLYLIAALVLILEAVCMALWWRFPRLRNQRGLLQALCSRKKSVSLDVVQRPLASQTPKCSVIVVAYLPNEQGIILETLQKILQDLIRPAGGLEVILAYNTPYRLPIEADLWELTAQYPELHLLHVENSHSKAENLNAALAVVSGEMTCIFDADHWPAPDALLRAWPWLSQGNYDVVQGRNVIRNDRENWLTRWIAVEFDCLYGVSHPARSLLVNAALFGGSNGYWRTHILQQVGFRDRMLTEDIDATLRSLGRGVRIVHDPQIISQELAPVDLGAFWSQRQRWTQGWLEVALKYQLRLPFWRGLDPWQKTCWLIMLLYSSFFHGIALQAFALMIHHWIWPSALPLWFLIYNGIVMNLSLLCNHYQATIANGRSFWHREGWFYTLVSPFFFGVKLLIVFVSLHNAYRGDRRWVVTRRQKLNAKAKPALTNLSKSR